MTQCPNCGGYRTQKFDRGPRPVEPEGPSGCLYFLIASLLVLSVFGALFGVLMLLGVRSRKQANQDRKFWRAALEEWEAKAHDPWYQHGYYCDLCGYQWLQRPGEQLQINSDPELRRKGEQRLREEEERRLREEEERRRREEEELLD